MLRFLGIGLLLFAFLPFRSTGKNVQDSLWHSYLKTKNPKQKTEIVIRIGEEYDLKNDLVSRDSVFDIALNDIYIKTEDSLLFILYRWYFEKDEEYFTDRASDYAKNFTEIAAKYEDNINSYYSYFAKAKLALYQFNTAQALEYAGQAFYYASLSENIDIKVNAMILLGYSLDWSNKKVEAFRKYIDALYLSKKSEKQDLILKCYNSLASFYYRIYNLGKAKEYVTEQYKILYQQSPLDSLALIRLDITNAHYLFENKERYAAENVAKRILDYTMRHGYEKLEQKIFVVYRTYLIDNGYLKTSQTYIQINILMSSRKFPPIIRRCTIALKLLF